MQIIFHAHHATISDHMRRQAERAVRRAARSLGRAVDAVVRFEQDGPLRRVEILLHAPGHRDIVASGEQRFFGRALADAAAHLLTRASRFQRTRGNRVRAAAPRVGYEA